MSEFSAK